MKKEEKVITKEDTIEESAVKIKRKFKSLKKWIDLIKNILIIATCFMLIGGMVDLYSLNKGDIKNINDFARPVVILQMVTELSEDEEIKSVINNSQRDNIGIFNFTYRTGDEINEKTEEKTNVAIMYTVDLGLQIVSLVAYIWLISCMSKIFAEVENTGTPFIEKNGKYMDKISICCLVLFIFGYGSMSVGLGSLILIESLIYIFKYGCKLQEQVDETL